MTHPHTTIRPINPIHIHPHIVLQLDNSASTPFGDDNQTISPTKASQYTVNATLRAAFSLRPSQPTLFFAYLFDNQSETLIQAEAQIFRQFPIIHTHTNIQNPSRDSCENTSFYTERGVPCPVTAAARRVTSALFAIPSSNTCNKEKESRFLRI